jgi:hypothetical protein
MSSRGDILRGQTRGGIGHPEVVMIPVRSRASCVALAAIFILLCSGSFAASRAEAQPLLAVNGFVPGPTGTAPQGLSRANGTVTIGRFIQQRLAGRRPVPRQP